MDGKEKPVTEVQQQLMLWVEQTKRLLVSLPTCFSELEQLKGEAGRFNERMSALERENQELRRLRTAVRTLGKPVSRRLGDVLVAQGLITQDGLARAIAAQKGTSERLGSVLLRLNLVAEEQLLGSLSRQYGVPSITVSQLEIDPEALNLVPAQIAKKHAVLPIKRVGNMLTLAMADPTDVFALDNVAFMTNLQILPLVASEVAIREGIERHYEGQTSGITDIVSELK